MKATIFWLMILVAAVSGYAIYKLIDWRDKSRRVPQHVQVDYAQLARERNLGSREFVLTDQDGNLFASDELRGKVWVLSFFFSTCGKECRELNKKLVELQRAVPHADLHFVSISCTPELDTPQVLRGYQAQFQGNPLKWHMLTGNFNYIEEKLAKPLQVTYERGDHTQRIVIIDRHGSPREYLGLLPPDPSEQEQVMERAKSRLAELLAESAAVPELEKKLEGKMSSQHDRGQPTRQFAEVSR